MRRALVVPLVLAVATACSSSTAPKSNSLSGIWRATSATLPTGVEALQVTLTPGAHNNLTGNAVLVYIGGRPQVTFTITGMTGMSGGSCNLDVVFNCHTQFQFTATAPNGDVINFVGGFIATDSILGDVFTSPDLPFANVDGRALGFALVARQR